VTFSSRREPVDRRSDLVARLSETLTWPRLQLALMMTVAGAAAFLCSAVLLWSRIEVFGPMAPRYGAAALFGYLTFLLMIRVWISLHRPTESTSDDISPLDTVDFIDVSHTPLPSAPSSYQGGGGPADRQAISPVRSSASGNGYNWGPVDVDGDCVWLVIAAMCAAGGAVAIVYVVYMAPVLLAEVALDAAIISVLYRRLRRDEQGYWLTTVLRRTWGPALVLVVFAFLTGFALQKAAPEARSIGAVFQSVAGPTPR
jgi:hypothetical protein